jgi:hypothetical protein
MHTKKATKYVGMKRRSCRLSPPPPTENARNQTTCLCWTIRSVNPLWTSVPSGPPSSQQKSTNYNTVKCSLSGNICFSCVGIIRRIRLSSDDFCLDSSLMQCLIRVEFLFNILMFCLISHIWFVLCLACIPILVLVQVSGDRDYLYVLPEDGDKIQCPKRCVLKYKQDYG